MRQQILASLGKNSGGKPVRHLTPPHLRCRSPAHSPRPLLVVSNAFFFLLFFWCKCSFYLIFCVGLTVAILRSSSSRSASHLFASIFLLCFYIFVSLLPTRPRGIFLPRVLSPHATLSPPTDTWGGCYVDTTQFDLVGPHAIVGHPTGQFLHFYKSVR